MVMQKCFFLASRKGLGCRLEIVTPQKSVHDGNNLYCNIICTTTCSSMHYSLNLIIIFSNMFYNNSQLGQFINVDLFTYKMNDLFRKEEEVAKSSKEDKSKSSASTVENADDTEKPKDDTVTDLPGITISISLHMSHSMTYYLLPMFLSLYRKWI